MLIFRFLISMSFCISRKYLSDTPKNFDFTYGGTCQAPDYIYSIPPGGAMVPDGEVYDIACVEEARFQEVLGKQDCYTELGFLLAPGFTYEGVKGRLEEALELYGLKSLCERKDQTSYNMVDGEIGELISVGTILPLLFMAISVFMLYVVLKKMVDRNQKLIGTMKAAFAICFVITAAACLAENLFVKKICLTDILKKRE